MTPARKIYRAIRRDRAALYHTDKGTVLRALAAHGGTFGQLWVSEDVFGVFFPRSSRLER